MTPLSEAMLAGEAASWLSSTSVVGEPVTVWQPARAAPANSASAIMGAIFLPRGLNCIIVFIMLFDRMGVVTAPAPRLFSEGLRRGSTVEHECAGRNARRRQNAIARA